MKRWAGAKERGAAFWLGKKKEKLKTKSKHENAERPGEQEQKSVHSYVHREPGAEKQAHSTTGKPLICSRRGRKIDTILGETSRKGSSLHAQGPTQNHAPLKGKSWANALTPT